MGLERVVLDKIEELDGFASAYFSWGDLYIELDDYTSPEDVEKIVEGLKEVVLCRMRSTREGNEIKIEFVH